MRLDHDFLPGDRDLYGSLLLPDLLPDPNLAGLNLLILGPELPFTELDPPHAREVSSEAR